MNAEPHSKRRIEIGRKKPIQLGQPDRHEPSCGESLLRGARRVWPKFLMARCVMLANITASGHPASGFLTRLRLDERADARRKGEG